jgi:hypothetical protein
LREIGRAVSCGCFDYSPPPYEWNRKITGMYTIMDEWKNGNNEKLNSNQIKQT